MWRQKKKTRASERWLDLAVQTSFTFTFVVCTYSTLLQSAKRGTAHINDVGKPKTANIHLLQNSLLRQNVSLLVYLHVYRFYLSSLSIPNLNHWIISPSVLNSYWYIRGQNNSVHYIFTTTCDTHIMAQIFNWLQQWLLRSEQEHKHAQRNPRKV